MRTLWKGLAGLLALSYRLDRGRLLRSALLVLLAYLATPVAALLLRTFTNQAVARQSGPAVTTGAVLALVLVLELMLGHFAHLSYFELGEEAERALNSRLITAASGSATLERSDQVEFADTVALVREDLPQTRPALEACLQLCSLLLQLAVSTVILARLNPWLALLPLGAAPLVWIGKHAQVRLDTARELTAERLRLSKHLLNLATGHASVKEIRLQGSAATLLRRQEEQWQELTRLQWRAHRAGALLRACGQVLFAAVYGGAIWLVVAQAVDGTATAGDVVLVVALAVQISVQVTSVLTLMTTLRAAGRTLERLDDLARPATAAAAGRTASAPSAETRTPPGCHPR